MEDPNNNTSGYYPIIPLNIEEKPLLEFPEAAHLAALAVFTLVLGALVQVSVINSPWFSLEKVLGTSALKLFMIVNILCLNKLEHFLVSGSTTQE